MRRENVRLPLPAERRSSPAAALARRAKFGLLAPAYWLLAHGVGTPGLGMHARCARLGARLLLRGGHEVSRSAAFHFVVAPMDSVRYFEFDFAWRSMEAAGPVRAYLDVSSPRLFPTLVLAARPELTADLLNPDMRDLEETRRLVTAAGLHARCRLHGELVDDRLFAPESFDVITSLSVLEHIPDDIGAVRAIWRMLRPGGRLVLSVPCAKEPFEEYVDFNEYGLLAPDERGFVFGQRFYSPAMLAANVFAVTGPPRRAEVFGERRAGALAENRRQRLADADYPSYREPFMVGRTFARFPSVASLPFRGVAAMEFVKD
jgi:SAM-dependent methyltransferase